MSTDPEQRHSTMVGAKNRVDYKSSSVQRHEIVAVNRDKIREAKMADIRRKNSPQNGSPKNNETSTSADDTTTTNNNNSDSGVIDGINIKDIAVGEDGEPIFDTDAFGRMFVVLNSTISIEADGSAALVNIAAGRIDNKPVRLRIAMLNNCPLQNTVVQVFDEKDGEIERTATRIIRLFNSMGDVVLVQAHNDDEPHEQHDATRRAFVAIAMAVTAIEHEQGKGIGHNSENLSVLDIDHATVSVPHVHLMAKSVLEHCLTRFTHNYNKIREWRDSTNYDYDKFPFLVSQLRAAAEEADAAAAAAAKQKKKPSYLDAASKAAAETSVKKAAAITAMAAADLGVCKVPLAEVETSVVNVSKNKAKLEELIKAKRVALVDSKTTIAPGCELITYGACVMQCDEKFESFATAWHRIPQVRMLTAFSQRSELFIAAGRLPIIIFYDFLGAASHKDAIKRGATINVAAELKKLAMADTSAPTAPAAPIKLNVGDNKVAQPVRICVGSEEALKALDKDFHVNIKNKIPSAYYGQNKKCIIVNAVPRTDKPLAMKALPDGVLLMPTSCIVRDQHARRKVAVRFKAGVTNEQKFVFATRYQREHNAWTYLRYGQLFVHYVDKDMTWAQIDALTRSAVVHKAFADVPVRVPDVMRANKAETKPKKPADTAAKPKAGAPATEAAPVVRKQQISMTMLTESVGYIFFCSDASALETLKVIGAVPKTTTTMRVLRRDDVSTFVEIEGEVEVQEMSVVVDNGDFGEAGVTVCLMHPARDSPARAARV